MENRILIEGLGRGWVWGVSWLDEGHTTESHVHLPSRTSKVLHQK